MATSNIDLHAAREHLRSLGHDVYYIAVYGSQNYNLDYEGSDVDYKAIVLPSLDDIIRETKPVSEVLEFRGGQIDVKDIRSYVDSAVKCNINFVEILNTEHYLGDSGIRKFFIPLLKNEGQLFLKACYGMVLEKVQALRHPYPSIAHKIQKFGYDPKQLHHIVRLRILMQRYTDGEVGNFFHNAEEKERLMEYKTGLIPNELVDQVVMKNVVEAARIRDSYTTPPDFSTKYEMIEFSRKVVKENILANELARNTDELQSYADDAKWDRESEEWEDN